MSPLLLFLLLSITTTTTHAIALPQSSPDNLPDDITNSVPACAQSCIASFIAEGFPSTVCSDRGDLGCLCSKNSTTGYTVGEAALRCLISKCSAGAGSQDSAYGICAGQKNALPNTHSTITATMTSSSINSTTTTFSTTSTQSSSSSTGTPSTSDDPILTATTKPSPPFRTSIPTSSTSPSQSATDTLVASAAAVAPKPSGLTNAQIGGIAAASSASAFLAVIGVLFMVCLRRRRRRQRQSEKVPFDIKQAPTTPPNQNPHRIPPIKGKDPRGGVGGVGITHFKRISASLRPPVPPKAGGKRWSKWPRYERPEDIGIAMSPEAVLDTSPNSIASHRTSSRLLPDKPTFGLFPVPQQVHSKRPMRPESAATEFEEDLEEGSLDAAKIAELYRGHWPIDRDDALGRAAPQTSASASRILHPAPVLKPSAIQIDRPQLSLRLPTSLTPGGKMRGTMYLAPNPNDRTPNTNNSSTPPPNRRDILQPQTYTSSTKKKPPKTQWRSSSASETTFESSGQVTPENEQNDTLSPVAESPHHVRYPVIPGSTSPVRILPSTQRTNTQPKPLPHATPPNPHNQPPIIAPPNTIQPHCHSPSSLLAKRRGDRAAADLEMKLQTHKNKNSIKQNIPRKEIETPSSSSFSSKSQNQQQEGVQTQNQDPRAKNMILSPTGAWVPKLTPTRRGEELYLSVQ
ncbi:MAG: hypothetical protein M1812_004607 [Candelaria pacifica]|nr:MAG: hypothetical protein M1812_004607 [Candelaria pacifica]